MNDGFNRPRPESGWIEVIVGCMFSGKTEELIKQVRRANIARQKVQTFKPTIDARYSKTDVASHDQTLLTAHPVGGVAELTALIEPATLVVAVDEGQFFGPELVELATRLADDGKRVIVAGLDTDWRGQPFGPMPQLMAVAEVVRKQHAICRVCGAPASRTQRMNGGRENILVGSTESYEARCRAHFNPEVARATLTPPRESLRLTELD